MMLMVCPMALRIISDDRIESGIETITTKVLRALPRKSRIIIAVSSAAMAASEMTPRIELRTKPDWSNRGVIFSSEVT